MPPATRPCPVCNATSATALFEARDPHYGIPGLWRIVRCDGCGSRYVANSPSAAELASLYPQESYYSYSLARHSPWKAALQRLVGFSTGPREPSFPSPGRVLDFGCGAGDFLLRARANGWTCAGVEISDAARRVAREHGLDVRSSASEFAPASFDYVRANHSLEHVDDPTDVLRSLRALLADGGTLLVGIPTVTSLNARVFRAHWWYLTPPLHTYVPSTSGVLAMLDGAGFDVRTVRTRSDFAGIAGSMQVWLNRRSSRRANQGLLFSLKPLLVLAHWLARAEDLFGVGDKLEVIATARTARSVAGSDAIRS
ncbi:MAG TPA: class I SAM-dependent methyltransferase [Gemmatimonadaceae bacterium]|nr:class I SAM-dependent methyltransferase [Gemmatimonadaceae bacterium]